MAIISPLAIKKKSKLQTIWDVYKSFLTGGMQMLPLPEPEVVADKISTFFKLPQAKQVTTAKPIPTETILKWQPFPIAKPIKISAEKVAYGAGAVTSQVGQFVIAGNIANSLLGEMGKFNLYRKYAKALGVSLPEVYKAEKTMGLIVKAKPQAWLKSAIQWGIYALPRLQEKDFYGKARELATSMITGGAFGRIAEIEGMKPVVRYLANVAAPYIIKSTIAGKPKEAKEEISWYAAMSLPALFLGGIEEVKGKGRAVVKAPKAGVPSIVTAPPAPKLPIGEGRVTPKFQAKLTQEKIAKAEAGVAERLTQKPLEKGALEGKPLARAIPTPLEEAITKTISPEEIKEIVKPKTKTPPKEIEKFVSELKVDSTETIMGRKQYFFSHKGNFFGTGEGKTKREALEEMTKRLDMDRAIRIYKKLKPDEFDLRKTGIPKTEEQILAEARGEVKAEAIEVAERKAGVDLKDVLKRMKATKEGEWSLPNIKGMAWDELAQDLGYTEGGTKEIERVGQPNIMVNQELYDHLVMLKGGQPSAPAREIVMPKTKLPQIRKTAKKLGVRVRYADIPEAPGQVRIFPVYHAVPTKEIIARVAKKEAEDIKREADALYKEWQQSYRSETMTSIQALNKGLRAMKESTDKAVKDRLDKEVARIFAPDYRTPEYVFDKFGLKDKVYTPLKKGQESISNRTAKEYIPKVNSWFKRAKKIKNYDQRLFDYKDGIKIDLPPEGLEIIKEADALLEKLADEMGLPKSRRLPNYITHLFEPDFEGAKRVFPDELAKILDYTTPNKEFNPFLEKRLGARGYKRSFFDAMDAYVYRAYRKIYLDKALNQAASYVDALPLQASRYTDNFLKRFKNRPSTFEKWLDQNILQPLPPNIKNLLGSRPASKLTNLITTQVYRGTLGFNFGPALRNLTQGVNTFAELGAKYTTIGYSQLMARGVKELKDEDVLSDMIVADYKNTSLRSSLRKLDAGLFYLFETSEKINRGAAYYGTKQKFLDEGLSEEEAIIKAKESVRKTQFAYGKLDTPLALQTATGRLFFTLATYPLKQFEFIGGYAKKRAWAQLVRYLVSSFVLVALFGKYLGIDYEDVFAKNIMPTLGILPKALIDIFGAEWKREKVIKNLITTLTIPGYGQLKKIGAIIKGESRTVPSKRYPRGQRRFKIETPQDIIKTLLSGEWSTTEAEKYLIKKGLKSTRTFLDDLLYIITGKKEYAPKKGTKQSLKLPSLVKSAYALEKGGSEFFKATLAKKRETVKPGKEYYVAQTGEKGVKITEREQTTPTKSKLTSKPDESYRNRTYHFKADLYDEIDKIQDEEKRNLIFALAAQESAGGKNLEGDYDSEGNPRSFGPYHINLSERPHITKRQAMDFKWSTNYALRELNYWIKKGYTPAQALRMWNWNSGYVNTGPRYDVELLLLAQTGRFLKRGS